METLEYKQESKVPILVLPLIYFPNIFILCVCLLGLHVCMCTICISDASGGQRKAADLLKLELRMIVSHHVGSGNQTWVICVSNESSTTEPSSQTLSLIFIVKLVSSVHPSSPASLW